jgi:hypothetical protein
MNDFLTQIRLLFSESAESSHKTQLLYTKLTEITEKTPIILAYQAAAEALQAKHSWNVLAKWAGIEKSMSLFQKAIQEDSENAEIRFLRFSIQFNTPTILGYSKNLEEDKQKLVNLFPYLDLPTEMQQAIKKILLQSQLCSEEEKEILFSKKI